MTIDKAKILIVDDIPGNVKYLAEILKHDYQIFVATNGKDAIEIATSEQIDLILLDVMMPKMSGYEVCTQLKNNFVTAGITVIFVTGKNEVEDETKGLELGAVDYITKPVNPMILFARVRNHIESKRRRDDLEKISHTDALTGISNRRHFDQFLDQEWRRCIRGGFSLSIIMIDIDYFKQYNDYFGHSGGDDCLKKVATVLQQTLMRSTDFLARYGGEEFIIVLSQVEHKGAASLAEKLRGAVEKLRIPHPLSKIAPHVTISLGCATMIPIRGSSAQPLVNAADELLFAAKEQGRNQVKSTFM